jgi:hypothetical protein
MDVQRENIFVDILHTPDFLRFIALFMLFIALFSSFVLLDISQRSRLF